MQITMKPLRFTYCGSLLVAMLLAFRFTLPLEASELSGASLTGRILDIFSWALGGLLLALLVALVLPRVAAVIGLIASLLSVPLLFYAMAPGPFRSLFPGNYSVPLQSRFACDAASITTSLGFLAVLVLSLMLLYSRGRIEKRADRA